MLPRTDAGALVQVVVVLIIMGAVAFAARRERSLVLLTAGIGLVTLALMGVRTLH
jgi:hypothetical protein